MQKPLHFQIPFIEHAPTQESGTLIRLSINYDKKKKKHEPGAAAISGGGRGGGGVVRGSGGACETRAGKKKRAGRGRVGLEGRLGRGRGEEEDGGHVYCAWEVDTANPMEGERRKNERKKESLSYKGGIKRNLIE